MFKLLIACVLVATVLGQGSSNWIPVTPGGNTSCAHGDPYSFFYRMGTNDHVTVFFEGGGACWDLDSCLLPIYSTTVDVQEVLSDLDSRAGLLSNDPRSALVNDTILYLPYCTGDVHAGNQLSSYLVYHVGHKNMEAGLSYFKTLITTPPSQVNVAGCSAGSLGAFINAPWVFETFPNAASYKVWGDSEVGIVSPAQWAGAWANWDLTLAPIPGLAPQFTKDYRDDITGYILAQEALFYPQAQFAAYTSNADATQWGFYVTGGGSGDWTALMRQQFKNVQANVTNVALYIAAGDAHCQNADDVFWTDQSDGVYLYQWVNSLFQSTTLQSLVDCSPNCVKSKSLTCGRKLLK